MAGSAKLSKPSANSIRSNSATVQCSATGWALPTKTTEKSGDSKNGSETVTEYKDLKYSWSFSPGGGSASSASTSHTFSGLNAGSSATLSGTVKVSCTKTVTKKTWTTKPVPTGDKDENGNPIMKEERTEETEGPTASTHSIGTASDSVTVYTKPNSWSWSAIGSGKIIQHTLYAYEWNDLIEQCRKYKQWENQSSSVNVNVPQVRSGDLITASLYNAMASACGISKSVNGGREGTIISADLFIALANAVS